jgi:hypothetical protein
LGAKIAAPYTVISLTPASRNRAALAAWSGQKGRLHPQKHGTGIAKNAFTKGARSSTDCALTFG